MVLFFKDTVSKIAVLRDKLLKTDNLHEKTIIIRDLKRTIETSTSEVKDLLGKGLVESVNILHIEAEKEEILDKHIESFVNELRLLIENLNK